MREKEGITTFLDKIVNSFDQMVEKMNSKVSQRN